MTTPVPWEPPRAPDDGICSENWEGLDESTHLHECGRHLNHEGACCCGTCGRVRLERRRDTPIFSLSHDVAETHKQGHMSIENLEMIQGMNLLDCDVGFQMAYDGRLWVCINGVAFLRFKPGPTTPAQ